MRPEIQWMLSQANSRPMIGRKPVASRTSIEAAMTQ